MRISEIMDNYTDNEFLIEGQQAVSSDEIAAGVMDKIKVKKPLKLKAKILIIAAAVVTLAGIMGAAINDAFFTDQLGNEISHFGAWSSTYGDMIPPYTIVESEEGKKVFFTANNEYIDITDYINRGENYYYYFSEVDNQTNEYPAILCVGGTIDDMGFGEYYVHCDFNGSGIAASNVGVPDEGDKEWFVKFKEKAWEFRQKFMEQHEEDVEVTQMEATQGVVPQVEAAQGEVPQVEAAQGESAQWSATQGEAAQTEAAQGEVTQGSAAELPVL